MISLHQPGHCSITQEDKIDRLNLAEIQDYFNMHRALYQYVGTNVRQDLFVQVQLVAPGTRRTNDQEYKSLKKGFAFLKATRAQGLNLVKLGLPITRIVLTKDD